MVQRPTDAIARPVISLIHPTARVEPSEAFPHGWKNAFNAWVKAASGRVKFEYVLAVHESRWERFWELNEAFSDIDPLTVSEVLTTVPLDHGGVFPVHVVKNTGRDCNVDQINVAARASLGSLITGVMDDYYPPKNWDLLLVEAIPDLQSEAIVLCSSGASIERDRELMIGWAMTRKRFDRYGFILDPDFESMFSDNWYAHVARRDEAAGLLQIIERFDIQFDHRHPIFGKGQMDDIYALQNRQEAYLSGSVVFHQKVTGARVMVMCLPGESFRSEIVGSRFQLIDDVKAHSKYGIVAPHWCYTSNVYATRIELAEHALKFPSITKADDLILWVDDDNDLNFGQLAMLIEDLEAHPGLDIVVGWCWCDHTEGENSEARTWVMSCGRQDAGDLTCLRFTGPDFDRAIERGAFLIRSSDIAPHRFWSGFPVVLMRRMALERLGPQSFIPVIDRRVKNGFTSEDTSFFLRAADLGMECAVDIRVQVPHVKWRAIQPQYVPEREREQVERVQGRRFGP